MTDTIIEQYEMLNTAQLSTKEKIEQTKAYHQAYKDLVKLEKMVYQNEGWS